jgi:hypothetical protein
MENMNIEIQEIVKKFDNFLTKNPTIDDQMDYIKHFCEDELTSEELLRVLHQTKLTRWL